MTERRTLAVIRRRLLTMTLASVLSAIGQVRGGTQELRVVTRMAPPIVRMDQGELGGFAIELWNTIAQRLHVTTRYQVAPDVGALLQRVRSADADLGVGAISITSAREREFDFSQPILNAGLQIMVRIQGSDDIKGPQDLSGKRVATTPGSTSAASLRELKARVYQFPVLKFAYLALLDKKVDAMVFDAPVLLNYAAFAGKGRVKLVGQVFRQEDYGIVSAEQSVARSSEQRPVSPARRRLLSEGARQVVHELMGSRRPSWPSVTGSAQTRTGNAA